VVVWHGSVRSVLLAASAYQRVLAEPICLNSAAGE